jgi:protein-tyrosine phosphatase
LSEHRAQRFSPESAMRHELVLVMEHEHLRRIMAVAPALAGRVHLLGRWGVGPIGDPYGASRAEYEDCLSQLENSVMAWLDRIDTRRDAART